MSAVWRVLAIGGGGTAALVVANILVARTTGLVVRGVAVVLACLGGLAQLVVPIALVAFFTGWASRLTGGNPYWIVLAILLVGYPVLLGWLALLPWAFGRLRWLVVKDEAPRRRHLWLVGVSGRQVTRGNGTVGGDSSTAPEGPT